MLVNDQFLRVSFIFYLPYCLKQGINSYAALFITIGQRWILLNFLPNMCIILTFSSTRPELYCVCCKLTPPQHGYWFSQEDIPWILVHYFKKWKFWTKMSTSYAIYRAQIELNQIQIRWNSFRESSVQDNQVWKITHLCLTHFID